MKKTMSAKIPRPTHQLKRGKKGMKKLRGVPQLYSETKQQFNAVLTPHAIATLQKIADNIGDSRSQVIEKALRGEINLMEILNRELHPKNELSV